jgi:hypothetical protein
MEKKNKNEKQENPILGGKLLIKQELLYIRGGENKDHGDDEIVDHDKG